MPAPLLRGIVVGAGLAGLAAAHRLERAGARAVVLEARSNAGGWLAQPPLAGLEVEPPCVLPRRAPRLQALAQALDPRAPLLRQPLERAALPGRGGVRLLPLRARSGLAPGPLAGLRLARLQAIAEWLGARIDPARPDRETRLDDRSVSDLCHLYLGRRACRRLFAPLLESCFGLDADQTSRQLLFAWMSAAGEIELSLAHGVAGLARALAARLADLRLEARAQRVLAGGREVELETGERIAADAVILAVNAREVLRLGCDLGHVEREILAGLPVRSETWLALAAATGPRLPAALGWPGGSAATLLDATPPVDGTGMRLLWVRARGDADPVELVAAAGSLLPGIGQRVREQRTYRRENAPCFEVGHFRKAARLFLEAERRPERRIALCGDYLLGPDAESALASGVRAAEAVLAAHAARRAGAQRA